MAEAPTTGGGLPGRSRHFVFLDRDGVINVERGDYTTSIDEWEWAPGALEGIRTLTEAGFEIIVVTNQSCISRGILTEEELERIHDYMRRTVHEEGGDILRVYHCPHQKADNCSCRKPEPGMLLAAAEEFGINLADTFFIGDAPRDMEAAARAGVRSIFIDTTSARMNGDSLEPVRYEFRADNLIDAVGIVIRETFS